MKLSCQILYQFTIVLRTNHRFEYGLKSGLKASRRVQFSVMSSVMRDLLYMYANTSVSAPVMRLSVIQVCEHICFISHIPCNRSHFKPPSSSNKLHRLSIIAGKRPRGSPGQLFSSKLLPRLSTLAGLRSSQSRPSGYRNDGRPLPMYKKLSI